MSVKLGVSIKTDTLKWMCLVQIKLAISYSSHHKIVCLFLIKINQCRRIFLRKKCLFLCHFFLISPNAMWNFLEAFINIYDSLMKFKDNETENVNEVRLQFRIFIYKFRKPKWQINWIIHYKNYSFLSLSNYHFIIPLHESYEGDEVHFQFYCSEYNPKCIQLDFMGSILNGIFIFVAFT